MCAEPSNFFGKTVLKACAIILQMNIIQIIFNLNLFLLALDHLLSGSLALFFPKRAVKTYESLFGAKIPSTSEYFLILKPWGALGIFAGLVGLLPIFDPMKYKLVLGCLVVLLGLRIFYRLKFQKDSKTFLQLSLKRNFFHIGLILLCGGIILAEMFFLP